MDLPHLKTQLCKLGLISSVFDSGIIRKRDDLENPRQKAKLEFSFCSGIFLIEAISEQEEVLVMLHIIDNMATAFFVIE